MQLPFILPFLPKLRSAKDLLPAQYLICLGRGWNPYSPSYKQTALTNGHKVLKEKFVEERF